MKKTLSILISCALTLAILTACGGTSHTHSAAGSWNVDLKNHWQLCECGETFDTAAHTLENDVCTVCGNEIVTFEDGAAQLTVYNEQGDCVLSAFYSADGSVEYEVRIEYTYDADGNMLTQRNYSGEVLTSEHEYALASSGETYIAGNMYYNEDGTKSSVEYDENGKILCETYYAADGSVDYAYEYEYSADGSWMGMKSYQGSLLVDEQEFRLDEDGVQTTIKYVTYNEDGSYAVSEYDEYGNETLVGSYAADGTPESEQRFESEYDAEGNRTLRRTYEDGRLTEEMEFWFGSDEDGSWSMSGKTTTYHEDGSYTVSDGDLEATWSSEITYDAGGNVVEEIRYEYEYDEAGESIGSKGYKNGNLFVETQGIRNEEGEATGMLWTDYHEDGGKTVYEYNENFNLVKVTVYDAAGNVISES